MSFKIVRTAGQTKDLRTSSFPVTGVTTTTNLTFFFWVKTSATSKYHRIALWSDDAGFVIDKNRIGIEGSGNKLEMRFEPYSQDAGTTTTGNGVSANTWHACIGRTQLGGSAAIKLDSGTEATDAMGSPWHLNSGEGMNEFKIGGVWDGGDSDSVTVYFAHVCIWKARLSDTDRDSLLGGANPLAIDASNILEYWTGASLTGYNSTVLSESGTGTFTADDADNPTVDDPPGGGSAVPLLMQMYSGS